ncbi:amidohydrolase [Craterilacuibacter sp.]|uniref:amidohydrolase n=1 Tax=Craterilacuibacter sp. TaxID=2870909 RepID=UPI003F3EB577
MSYPMRSRKLSLPLLLLAAGVLSACSSGGSGKTADDGGTIYINAKAYTQNDKRQVAEAFVVADGKFIQVGSKEDALKYQSRGYKVVDLGGKMVMPGLHDNHIHTLGTVPLDMCDLDGQAVTLDELADKVKACLPKYAPAKGEWLVVNQWSPYDGNQETDNYKTVLLALDTVAPNNPVMLAGADGHASAYNSKALAMAKDKDGKVVGFNSTTLSDGGVFEEFISYVDLKSGVIREDARSRIPVPDTGLLSGGSPEAAKLYDAILPQVSDLIASRGITGVQDACANDFIRQRLLNMQQKGLLNMRVTAASCFNADDYAGKVDIAGHLKKANEVRQAFAGNPLIKADAVKIFVDGVLEGDPFSEPPFLPNAGMLANYQTPNMKYDPATDTASIVGNSTDSDNNGIVNYEVEDLKDYVSALDKDGFSVHMHSVGDRSTRVALDALQAARDRNGKTGIPHTIAHLQMVSPEDQKRLGELGVFLTFTYAWTTPQMAYDMLVTPFLQPSTKDQDLAEFLYNPLGYVTKAVYPAETSRKAGAILVAGSDAPVDSRDPRPFINIAAGVTKSAAGKEYFTAYQRSPLAEMLAAYTINGARAVRQDKITGSIETGKSADFIVLSQNLFDLEKAGTPEKIADTQVDRTVFMGKTVYLKK